MVQLSFTLPVPADARAREVALEFLRRNGLREPQIVHIGAADRDMAFFVAYAKAAHGVDPDSVVGSEVEAPALGFKEVNSLIERELCRRLRPGALPVDRRREPGCASAVRAPAARGA